MTVLQQPVFVTVPLTGWTRGVEIIAWGEEHLQVLKGPLVGEPLRYMLWQRFLIERLFEERDDGRLRYRRGLVGVGRQGGKTTVGTSLGLHALFTGPPGSEVYAAAGDRQQARIVFREAQRQVAGSPLLSKIAKVYRDAIEIPDTGSVWRVLSADAKLQQGLSPYFVVFDEVHVQPNEDLWDALTLGMGARVDPLILGITTAGGDPDSLAGRLYDYGKRVVSGEVDDDSFFFAWWEADAGCDIFDRGQWEKANPALAEGLLSLDDFETAAKQQTEAAFRRYRLNQWVRLGGTGWMDMDAWNGQARPDGQPPDGSRIVVSFDGSVDRDATVLYGMSIDGDAPYGFLIGAWEKPEHDPGWQVPRDEVHARVDDTFRRWDVAAFGADPAWWRSELQEWDRRYPNVMEWPVTNARMGPACASTYAHVRNGTLFHDGDPLVTRHVGNAVQKDLGQLGVTIRKASKDSPRKIDAAVCVVMAVDLWERFATIDGDESGTLLTF